jgi:hypothetical protein
MSCCPFLKGDDSRILTGCGDGIIRLWSVESGKKITELKDHTKDISSLSVLDTNVFAASSYDGSCTLWDLRTSSVTNKYYGNGNNILTSCLHPSGQGVAVGFENGVVSYYDYRAMAELVKFSLVTNGDEEGKEKEAGGAPREAKPTEGPPAPKAGDAGGEATGGDGQGDAPPDEPPEVKSGKALLPLPLYLPSSPCFFSLLIVSTLLS